jgi:hypothetical protein
MVPLSMVGYVENYQCQVVGENSTELGIERMARWEK